MRYFFLLLSCLALVACSSAQEPEVVAVATATSAPIPTWTPTPLPTATFTGTPEPTATPTPTSTPEPTLVPVTLAQVELAIGFPFQDTRSRDGLGRSGLYESPFNGLIMITLVPDLSRFGNAWARLALGDQDAARKFKATFRTLSILLLDTNTAAEAIMFVDACYSNSVIPAVVQIKDTECVSTLSDGTSLKVEYHYESNILLTWVETTQ